MSANCDVIVIFPIYGEFGAIRKPDSGRIICKTYIFIILQNQCKKKSYKKNADTSEIKNALVLKGIFSETTYVCTYVPNLKFLV